MLILFLVNCFRKTCCTTNIIVVIESIKVKCQKSNFEIVTNMFQKSIELNYTYVGLIHLSR